ncbi:MAG TPA: formate/nitrite transporter family protein [Corynebacteriales bacterium]|nr:formate/nitrite transporter family protein [Mycobacteriales bacterium]
MAKKDGQRSSKLAEDITKLENDVDKKREKTLEKSMEKLKDEETFHHEDALDDAFTSQINEGRQRLARPRPQQFITGFMGGVEIGLGILAGVAVTQASGSQLLGGVAFSFGFIILLLAHSELFTEGFLIPTTAYIARRAKLIQLIRFWFYTFLGNLVGGFLVMWMTVTAYPHLNATIAGFGQHFAELSPNLENVVLAILAGTSITLMTRMQIGTKDVVGKIVASLFGGVLLFGVGMLHSVLDTLLMFGGWFAGAPDSNPLAIIQFLWWIIPLNMIGGIVGVAIPRTLQAKDRVKIERLRVARDLLAGNELAGDARGALKTGADVRRELEQEVEEALEEQEEDEEKHRDFLGRISSAFRRIGGPRFSGPAESTPTGAKKGSVSKTTKRPNGAGNSNSSSQANNSQLVHSGARSGKGNAADAVLHDAQQRMASGKNTRKERGAKLINIIKERVSQKSGNGNNGAEQQPRSQHSQETPILKGKATKGKSDAPNDNESSDY